MTDLSTFKPELRDIAAAMPSGLAVYASKDSKQPWVPYRFHSYLNSALLDVAYGRTENLAIMTPPRHGKSELASKFFPAWFLGTWPEKRVMLASYADTMARKFGRDARDLLIAYGDEVFGPACKIRDDVSSVNEWDTVSGGGMFSMGVGGPGTGRGADLLIVDDPVKNAEEANSEVYRDKTFDWWQSVASTRLHPGGRRIIIQTRWHEDDLLGRVLELAKETGEIWRVLKFPAIAEENDVLGRSPGEALVPERYPVETLLKRKISVGSYVWSALYQQDPVPAGGAFFKREWFRYCRLERIGDAYYYILTQPNGDEKRVAVTSTWAFQTCDPAATEDEENDWFVISTWVVTPDNEMLLVDVLRLHADTTSHLKHVRNAWAKWRAQRLRFIGVEDAVYGKNIIQALKKDATVQVRALPADKDKRSRALPVATRYENGTVYHLAGAPWLLDYEKEMLQFPLGKNDDQVDTAAYAANCLDVKGGRQVRAF